jgi:hypothetical protein
MSKQTAVEWLEKEIWKRGPIGEDTPTWLKELYEQAKEMERIQNQQSFQDGQWDVAKHVHDTQIKDNNDKVEI